MAARTLPAPRALIVRGCESRIKAIAISPDSRVVSVGLLNTELHRFDLATGEYIQSGGVSGGYSMVLAGNPATGQRYLGTVGGVHTPDAVRAAFALGPRTLEANVTALAVSADGATLYVGDSNGAVHLCDAVTGARRTTLPSQRTTPTAVTALAVCPRGSRLYVGNRHSIDVWALRQGGVPMYLSQASTPAAALAITRDGQRLFSVGSDATHSAGGWFRCWRTGGVLTQAYSSLLGQSGTHAVVLSPDDTYVCFVAQEKEVVFLDGATGIRLCSFVHVNYVHALAFSPDGRYLCASGAVLAYPKTLATRTLTGKKPLSSAFTIYDFGSPNLGGDPLHLDRPDLWPDAPEA